MCKLTKVQQQYIDDLKAAHAAGFCVMYRPSQECCWVQCQMPTWSKHPSCYSLAQEGLEKWERYKRDRDCCTEQQEHKTKPHPHAALIKAWADGAVIQVKLGGTWGTSSSPNWREDHEYRIKPEQTDVEKYGVEVGDIWETVTGPTRLFVARLHNVRSMFFTLSGTCTELGRTDKLLFRRGVVNKL